ncbi:MAG: response regulator [Anaerolineaceae bacterium]|nr:response regulator [Anaerolineaceae bacterium]
MSLILEEFGFKLDILYEKSEIKKYVATKIPRLYLIDVFLPEWNGLELISFMKDEGFLDKTRVIMVSSFGYQEVVQQAILSGASDFILKPFDKITLLTKVKTQLMERYHGGNQH